MQAMKYREESLRYPGWRVVVICQIGVLSGIATIFFSIFTLFVKPWQREFGWNREQIAQAFTFAAMSVAVCSPFIGRLLDRIEPRRLIAAMMTVFGLGFASLAWLSPHLLRLQLTAVFLGIAGTGTYQLGYARIVASWFERRLGAALSVVVAGSGLGSLVLPPLVQHAITAYGWRDTILMLSVLPLLVGAPLTLWLAPSRRMQAQKSATAASDATIGLSWRQALRSRTFWLIAGGIGCMSLAENGLVVHLAPMLSDRGLKPENAAIIVSVLGGASITGRLLLGWVLDYAQAAYIAMGALLLGAGGIFFLAHAQTFNAAILAALMAGLGMGCEFDLVPYMLKRYFGMRAFSTLYGVSYSVYAIAGGTAPLWLGYIYDSTGSYTRVLSWFSLLAAAIAFGMLALPAYRYAAEAPSAQEHLPEDLNPSFEGH